MGTYGPTGERMVDPGLAGTHNSSQYRISEIERHLHHNNRWFGLAAVPAAETHRADREVMTPFQLTAGNDTWGAWLQILGSSDTPDAVGSAYFDLNTLLISDVAVAADTDIHIIQIAFGEVAATAYAAGDFTEVMVSPLRAGQQNPLHLKSRRYAAGTKVWMRHWVDGENAPTMDCFFDLHEYEG